MCETHSFKRFISYLSHTEANAYDGLQMPHKNEQYVEQQIVIMRTIWGSGYYLDLSMIAETYASDNKVPLRSSMGFLDKQLFLLGLSSLLP